MPPRKATPIDNDEEMGAAHEPEGAPMRMARVRLLKGYWTRGAKSKRHAKGEELLLPAEEAIELLNAKPPIAERADPITYETL